MTTSKTDPLVGHTLAGKYVIEALVHEEGLGKVYDAVILPARQPVSVKVLHPNLVEDKEAFGRFGREMMATAAIQHPNTVEMLDFGEHRGIFHFIVLERFPARSLAEELGIWKQLSVDRATHIAAQIASALITAHSENIVHRNLVPENILLLDTAVGGDFVKIRDFGFSRLHDAEGNVDDDISDVTTRVGTVSYMAPEYIDAGIVDPRGDLYALGILLYEMLTGAPPFVGRQGEVLEAHLRDIPPPPSSRATVPLWLDELVAHLLEKDLLDRPRHAAEVLTALQRGTRKRLDPPQLSREAQPRPRPKGTEPPRQREEEAPASGGTGVLGALGVIVLIVVIVGIIAAVLGSLPVIE